MATNKFSFVSYNMRGFQSGLAMVRDLSRPMEFSIITVQEHWLSSDRLDRLGMVNDHFCFYGVSGMNEAVSSSLLKGRVPLAEQPFYGNPIIPSGFILVCS